MVNNGFNCTNFLAGQCHLQNDERLILKRHFVDHLYKEEKAKDLRSRNNARSSDITEYIAT